MKKSLLFGAALTVIAGQAFAATVSYEIGGQTAVGERVYFAVTFDLDTLPFQLPDSTLRISGSNFAPETLRVTNAGLSTAYSAGFGDPLTQDFPWIVSLNETIIQDYGSISLDLDGTGTVSSFRASGGDGNVDFLISNNGCGFDNYNTFEYTPTCISTFVRQTGSAVVTTAAVPLPLPGLMLGAGLLGFMGLRRKKAA